MPDEVVAPEGGAPAEPTLPREPTNVRDALKLARESGVPIYQEPTEPPAPAPVVAPDPVDAAIADLTQPPAESASPTAAAGVAPAGTPDPYARFGGEQAVADATAIAQGLRTESGVRALVAQGLTALGYDVETVRQLLVSKGATPADATQAAQQAAAQQPDPYADIADDESVTGADLKRIVADATQRAVQQTATQFQQQLAEATRPLNEGFEHERQMRSQSVVDGTLVEMLGAPPADPAEQTGYQALAREVLAAAAPYVQEGNWDPAHIRAAVLRGHADTVARQEAALKAYAQRKAADRAKLPVHVGGGGSPGGEELPEPKNVKEAISRRKAEGIR